MLQNIIVIVILIAVAVYLAYKTVKFFSKKDEKSFDCGCEGCELKNNCAKKQ